MKQFLALLAIAGICSFASCSSGGGTISNVNVVPSSDSSTKGSYIQVAFNTKTFFLTDLAIRHSPLIGLNSVVSFNPGDSSYMIKVILTDYKSQQISMNLTALRTTNDPIGDYVVVDNNSTLTDYSNGENKNYSIAIGSVISVTNYSPVYIAGNLNLNLYYNHTAVTATGFFRVYQ